MAVLEHDIVFCLATEIDRDDLTLDGRPSFLSGMAAFVGDVAAEPLAGANRLLELGWRDHSSSSSSGSLGSESASPYHHGVSGTGSAVSSSSGSKFTLSIWCSRRAPIHASVPTISVGSSDIGQDLPALLSSGSVGGSLVS